MNTIFILILTLTSTGKAMHSIEFNSLDECKTAGEQWIAANNSRMANWVCVKRSPPGTDNE